MSKGNLISRCSSSFIAVAGVELTDQKAPQGAFLEEAKTLLLALKNGMIL